MPNWVEGKLKIRGKPEDIKRWVEDCRPAKNKTEQTKMGLLQNSPNEKNEIDFPERGGLSHFLL